MGYHGLIVHFVYIGQARPAPPTPERLPHIGASINNRRCSLSLCFSFDVRIAKALVQPIWHFCFRVPLKSLLQILPRKFCFVIFCLGIDRPPEVVLHLRADGAIPQRPDPLCPILCRMAHVHEPCVAYIRELQAVALPEPLTPSAACPEHLQGLLAALGHQAMPFHPPQENVEVVFLFEVHKGKPPPQSSVQFSAALPRGGGGRGSG